MDVIAEVQAEILHRKADRFLAQHPYTHLVLGRREWQMVCARRDIQQHMLWRGTKATLVGLAVHIHAGPEQSMLRCLTADEYLTYRHEHAAYGR